MISSSQVREIVQKSLYNNFLATLNTQWQDHKVSMQVIKDVFMYMVSGFNCSIPIHIKKHFYFELVYQLLSHASCRAARRAGEQKKPLL